MAPGRRPRGFTLLELVVVLAIIALLLTIVAPRYFGIMDRGRVDVQQANLGALRTAIDHFHGDNGRWPASLEELVEKRYLRAVPVDPATEQADWVLVPPPDGKSTGIYDVRSNAPQADPSRP